MNNKPLLDNAERITLITILHFVSVLLAGFKGYPLVVFAIVIYNGLLMATLMMLGAFDNQPPPSDPQPPIGQ